MPKRQNPFKVGRELQFIEGKAVLRVELMEDLSDDLVLGYRLKVTEVLSKAFGLKEGDEFECYRYRRLQVPLDAWALCP